jgi:hypothetical protein
MQNDQLIDANVPSSKLDALAILRGAVTDLGGSLVMSTVLGIAAISAMLARGESPERIATELPRSFALTLFVAIAGLVMSTCGGYVAAAFAGRNYLKHALLAGLLSTALNFALQWLLGVPEPMWLSAATLACITPCAVLGGWLAMPVPMPLVLSAQARR